MSDPYAHEREVLARFIADKNAEVKPKYTGPPGVKKLKTVRLMRTTGGERFADPRLTNWRVEELAYGIDWFTVAGFPTLGEAKEYRRKILRRRRATKRSLEA